MGRTDTGLTETTPASVVHFTFSTFPEQTVGNCLSLRGARPRVPVVWCTCAYQFVSPALLARQTALSLRSFGRGNVLRACRTRVCAIPPGAEGTGTGTRIRCDATCWHDKIGRTAAGETAQSLGQRSAGSRPSPCPNTRGEIRKRAGRRKSACPRSACRKSAYPKSA